MKRRNAAAVAGTVNPAHMVAQRLSSLVLVILSIALILVAKIDTSLIDRARAPVVDAVAPVLAALNEPARVVESGVAAVNSWISVHGENAQLRVENERLRKWHAAAMALDAENARLRDAMGFAPAAPVPSVGARVVSDSGGVFVRSVVVNAGARDGLAKGQAVMSGAALVGRIVDVGEWSARALLITDLNARVPVILGDSGSRAVLAGDNSPQPKLLYLPEDQDVSIGTRVVTSGFGGVLPPGLAVGVVSGFDGDIIRVRPAADLARVSEVRVFDFPVDNPLVRARETATPAPELPAERPAVAEQLATMAEADEHGSLAEH